MEFGRISTEIKVGQSAQCKICTSKLKAFDGPTKRLHEHLKRVHQITVLKRKAHTEDNDEHEQTPGTRSYAASYTTAKVEEVVARVRSQPA